MYWNLFFCNRSKHFCGFNLFIFKLPFLLFLWGHWYPCFGLLVTSVLGFEVRMNPLFLCSITCIKRVIQIHLWYKTSWPLVASMEAEHFLIYALAHTSKWDLNPGSSIPLHSVTDTLRMNNADLAKYEIHMHEKYQIWPIMKLWIRTGI